MTHKTPESIKIIKVPTEAGTHFPGQCRAPDAVITSGGLFSKLEAVGYSISVDDRLSDNNTFSQAAPWTASPKRNGVRNEENALVVMKAIHEHLHNNGDDLKQHFPIILGGDCSITPAVFSGLCNWHPPGTKIGLMYIDGDADLTLPAQTEAEGSSAILDSMTITHLTGRPGGLESMKSFARADGSPLAHPNNIVLFGFDPLQLATEHWVYLLENGFKVFTRPTVRSDPLGCTRSALSWFRKRVDVVYVHFDVDVINSGEFPLANYPHYAGLEFKEAMEVLKEVLSNDQVAGLTLTEINPNNDAEGAMVERLVDGIVQGMARRKVLTWR